MWATGHIAGRGDLCGRKLGLFETVSDKINDLLVMSRWAKVQPVPAGRDHGLHAVG
jgi:hypothetical protein